MTLKADAKQFERMLAGEIDNYTLDKRFIRKDGEIVYTNLAIACIRGPIHVHPISDDYCLSFFFF